MSNESNIYTIELDEDVLKALRKLPKDVVGRLSRAINGLATNPGHMATSLSRANMTTTALESGNGASST